MLIAYSSILKFTLNPANMPKFDSCCNQEDEFQFDCPCTEAIPTGMSTAFLIFDIGDFDPQSSVISGTLDFTCCSGDLTLSANQSLTNASLPTGYLITYGGSTVDGTYSFTVNFQNLREYGLVVGTGSFTVYFTVCGTTIPLKVNYTYEDNCTEVLPTLIIPPTIEWESTTMGQTQTITVDFSTIACCGEITAVELTAITSPILQSGIVYTGFPVGYGFSGQGTIDLTFEFNLTNFDFNGFYSYYFYFEVCGLEFIQVVNFNITTPD